MIKIGSVNAGSSVRRELHIDFRLTLEEALNKVGAAIAKLTELIRKGGQAGCDVIVLPEDCLCTSAWENGNPEQTNELLHTAVDRMLERLGAAAAESGSYLICCNDRVDRDGKIRNTAFFLGVTVEDSAITTRSFCPFRNRPRHQAIRFPSSRRLTSDASVSSSATTSYSRKRRVVWHLRERTSSSTQPSEVTHSAGRKEAGLRSRREP